MHDTRHETGCEALYERVLDALLKVERHRFIQAEQLEQAYANHPLPIGAGQTISQPFIVALMTELMELEPNHKVLEIGTGSGYQAAVLAEWVETVYSIEIVETLGLEAARALTTAGYRNVHTDVGDGYFGRPDQAPFDAIILTAAIAEVPQPLFDQLKAGGSIVLPLGDPDGAQSLSVVIKTLMKPLSIVLFWACASCRLHAAEPMEMLFSIRLQRSLSCDPPRAPNCACLIPFFKITKLVR